MKYLGVAWEVGSEVFIMKGRWYNLLDLLTTKYRNIKLIKWEVLFDIVDKLNIQSKEKLYDSIYLKEFIEEDTSKLMYDNIIEGHITTPVVYKEEVLYENLITLGFLCEGRKIAELSIYTDEKYRIKSFFVILSSPHTELIYDVTKKVKEQLNIKTIEDLKRFKTIKDLWEVLQIS